MPQDDLAERWLLTAGPGTAEVGRALLARYDEPHRRYHNREHLTEVLAAVGLLGGDRTVQLAAWFHDAVYDPRRADNEERSAALAVAMLTGSHDGRSAEVARLVSLTASHLPAPGDTRGDTLCDADLAILGAPDTRYQRYASEVRVEYGHVPDAEFARGRAAILRDLLARERLYRTAAGAGRWEAAARANLSRELAGVSRY